MNKCQRCGAVAHDQTWDSKAFCIPCAKYLNFKIYPIPASQESCVQCGKVGHDHTDCACNCLYDTNADCPVHSFRGGR